MNPTPSQIEFARRRRERLWRIAKAAVESPLSQPQQQPEIVVLPPVKPDPTPENAIRVMWVDKEEPNDDRLTIEKIKRVVAKHFGVSVIDLESVRRDVRSTLPRQVAYFLSRKLTRKSLPDIGRRMGGRDHTSVISGIKKINRLLLEDAELASKINELMQVLQ